jgi:hypothetical protein
MFAGWMRIPVAQIPDNQEFTAYSTYISENMFLPTLCGNLI